ncbi:hypothetical protein [Micromonospora sp. NPDC050200]|uniref:hypothetical protein n=1 Tax=Micromonospora sp. NPDC050200 TaxID=3155664 RepID=UPI0033C09828
MALGRRVHSGGGTPRSNSYTRLRASPVRARISRTDSPSSARSRRTSAPIGSVTTGRLERPYDSLFIHVRDCSPRPDGGVRTVTKA